MGCQCCRESVDKKRRQRRRRMSIIRAKKSDGNEQSHRFRETSAFQDNTFQGLNVTDPNIPAVREGLCTQLICDCSAVALGQGDIADGKDDTVAGSLPASDFAQRPEIENSDDKLLRLCRGQGDIEDEIMRALQRSTLPDEEKSPMDELICQMRGGSRYSGGTIAICEGEENDGDEHALAAAQEWVDVEFEVALDSGSTDNVCHKGDAPGYTVVPSQGSQRGQKFVIGDGNKISNDGQVCLNLQTTTDDLNSIASIFQVAKVSRPLMSVGKICDNDMDVIFGKDRARVVTRDGAEVCTFHRSNGGLYLAKFRLKRPADGFGRQG